MIHHLSLSKTLVNMETGSFGKSSFIVSMADGSDEDRLELYNYLSKEKLSCGIYLDDEENSEYTVRYMAFTRQYVDFIMENGRFFEKKDFKPENKVAVIGKKVENTYKIKGKEYIQINGTEYLVIGKMGYEEDMAFDNYILVNLFACENELLNLYTLDFFSNIDEQGVINGCEANMKERGCELEVLAGTDSFADTVKIDFHDISYFAGLLSCYILCVLLISYQWLMLQRRELAVHRLVGASKKQVVIRIMSHYIAYMCISFLSGYIYCRFKYPSYRTSFFKGYSISVVIIIIFMFFEILQIKNDSVEEAIKK